LAHAAVVGLCQVPFAVAFGLPGVISLAVVTVAHVAIDRWKIRTTRHAEAGALAEAHRRLGAGASEGSAAGSGLGPAWTPVPAALFIVDQVLHALVIVGVWAVVLVSAMPLAAVAQAVDRLAGGWDRTTFHAAALIGVVGLSLVIVNVRAGAFFVATLVRPREAVEGRHIADEPHARAVQPAAWRLRLGPLEAVAAPEKMPRSAPERASSASPARIGATIGILERLLIATLVLAGSEAAIGLVVAAKTLARFRQLDDRDFAEYYLLGTLASVAVAVGSALLAAAAFRTLG
jgi:hypothetical protein